MAATVALGLGLAACGGDDGSGNSGGDSGGQSQADPKQEQLVKFSQCMRENGVAEFPDPVDGRLNLRVVKGGALDPSNPTFQSARDKCKALEPPGVLGNGPGGGNPAQQDQMLKFVECMRANGVPNFPDPGANGQFRITDEIDPNSPGFQQAMGACRDLVPGGAVVGGGQ